MRLLWWREAIERAAKGEATRGEATRGEATGHPVADAFGETLRRRALSPARVEALMEARGFDIDEKIMPDWPSLEAYLNKTAGTLFALAGEIMGARGEALERASRPAGLAYGLTGLMRAMPVHVAHARVYLPSDALRSHGTSPERVLAGQADEGLRHLLAELYGKARSALDQALDQLAALDTPARAAFRPLSLVAPYLAALERSDRDPLREIAEINPLRRLWRMAVW
jgi:phytoene synthase